MGLISKLFNKNPNYKYEQIYFDARSMGQSVQYAFKQAVDAAVKAGLYTTPAEAAKVLYQGIEPDAEQEDLPNLSKALNLMLKS
jgi:hypothetical protein